MKLIIEGEEREFEDLKAFRERYGLPKSFRIALFEPKDYTGLGSIEGVAAKEALKKLREGVLNAVPEHLAIPEWLNFVPRFEAWYKYYLEAINEHIGLRQPEIDFAAANFGAVCNTFVYAMTEAHYRQQPLPRMTQVYYRWLNGTVKISGTVHEYDYQGQPWKVQIVNHAYGRAGMIIYTGDTVCYVTDLSLECPADSFMVKLMMAVGERILASVSKSTTG